MEHTGHPVLLNDILFSFKCNIFQRELKNCNDCKEKFESNLLLMQYLPDRMKKMQWLQKCLSANYLFDKWNSINAMIAKKNSSPIYF